jgi:predicted O-methyltransferase YrrM
MKIAPNTFQGLHPDEVALFRTHLKGVKGTGVEIGCLDGYSSAVILDASELRLTSIDPFVPDSMEASLIGSAAKYAANVAPYGKRAHLIGDYSFNVANMGVRATLGYMPKLKDGLDFLFIDGDHTWKAVDQDFTEWTPHLKSGGTLAIHDARMGREGGANFHEGPSRVARERIFGRPEEWEVIGEAFSLILARKR